MNKLLLILALAFFSSCDQARQPSRARIKDTAAVTVPPAADPAVEPATPSDPIAVIRRKVEKINTMKLDNRHIEFMCDEKMMVDYFYAEGEIVKITVDFGTVGDVYAREAYYYDSGKLIFNYEFVEGGPACEGCIKTDEYRSYIVDSQVIKYLKNKTETTCRKCEFTPSSRQYKLLRAKTDEEVKVILCKGS